MAHGVAGMGDGVARFHSEHGGAGECCSATHSAAGRVPRGYHGDSIYNNFMSTCGFAGFTIPSSGGVDELLLLRLCGSQKIRLCILTFKTYFTMFKLYVEIRVKSYSYS